MRYPAERDFGTACAFIFLILAVLGVGIFGIVSEGIGARAATVVAGILVMLTALVWAWIWFGTAYEITSSQIIIRCGPFRSRIGIEEIVEAVPTCSGWLVAGGRHGRFALSRDAILIKGSKKRFGFLPYAVLISPQDKPGFLQALAEASPNLERSDDGSVRRGANSVKLGRA